MASPHSPLTARKQANPLLQGCIMLSQGAIGCFFSAWCQLPGLAVQLFMCPGPTLDLDASHSL